MRKYYLTAGVFLILTATVMATAESIPFRLINKLIIIRATVDGQSGNFILDTGVANLVLNSNFFAGKATGRTFHGLNGTSGEMAITFSKVTLGTNDWKKVFAEVIDLNHLEQVKGVTIHGLLGSNLFRNYTLLVDLQSMQIVLYPLDKQGENLDFGGIDPPAELLPFRYKGGTPLLEATVASRPLKLALDTGAGSNLLHLKYQSRLQDCLSNQEEKLLCGFGNEAQPLSIATLTHLMVGSQNCQPMPTLFASLDHWNSNVSGPVADGILGYAFFRQFRVAINFKKREVYLWPVSSRPDEVIVDGRMELRKESGGVGAANPKRGER